MDIADLVCRSATVNRPRLFLWLGMISLLPMPYVLTDIGWVPAVRLVALGTVTLSVWWAEGELVPLLIGGTLLLQALAAIGVCYWSAGAILRRAPSRFRSAVAAALVGTLLVAAQWPIYRTPLSAVAARATMWGMFR